MAIKITRRPVIIEAIQWTGDNAGEVQVFCGVVAGLDTLEVGSYIVRNEKGRIEVFSKSAFHLTFERHLVWEDNI